MHQLIDRQVTDVLHTSAGALAAASDLNATRSAARPRESAAAARWDRTSENWRVSLRTRLSPSALGRRADEAQDRLKRMFRGYLVRPLLPRYQARAAEVGLPRAVGDYLAGMTDRYCDQQYRQLLTAG